MKEPSPAGGSINLRINLITILKLLGLLLFWPLFLGYKLIASQKRPSLLVVLLIAGTALLIQLNYFPAGLFTLPGVNRKVTSVNPPNTSNVVIQETIVSPTTSIIPTPTIKINNEIPQELDDLKIDPMYAITNALENQKSIQSGQFYSVDRIVDGDTVVLSIIGTVRLIGIDTPETVDPRTTVQCFGKEASNYMVALLNNQQVYLEFDDSQGRLDKYGRTLAYIFRKDGLFINLEMIKKGYAFEYTYNLPYKYQADFKSAQSYAQINRVGLWSAQTCNGLKAVITSLPVQTPAVTLISTPMATTNTPIQSCKYSCASPDRDCSDFKTHAEAVSFFQCCHFTATNDPMKLDGVGVDDGDPCESLP